LPVAPEASAPADDLASLVDKASDLPGLKDKLGQLRISRLRKNFLNIQTVEDSYSRHRFFHWELAFADIFAARFQELFFRAWSDSRAIAQFDHPTGDRFQSYVQAQLGMATAAFQNRDRVADTFKLRLAPLAAGRIQSAVRLRQMLALHLESAVFVAIEEMVPMWLDFEPDALCRVGVQASILGRNIHLGARVRAISEKFRIHLHVQDIDTYRRFLPGGPDHAQLRDIVFWYLGQRHAIEIALWLPQPQVQPAVLGETAVLGWMACIAPDASQARQMVDVTRYTLTPQTLPQDIQRSA
jgi:type VI secretion system protein ImpH